MKDIINTCVPLPQHRKQETANAWKGHSMLLPDILPPPLPPSCKQHPEFCSLYNALSCQFSSVTQSRPTLCDHMDHSTPGLPVHPNSRSLLKLMSIESVMPSNHLILCRPLLLLPSIFPSIRVFSSELILRTRRPKYWSFSFSIRPSSEYAGLISFRMDWLDLLAVQGTLKSCLQHHSSKASILRHSLFFTSNSHIHR